MEETVYLNGALVPRSRAHLSVGDHAFLYGYGLYETMRAYNGKIFLLERHIGRLIESARDIGLDRGLKNIDLSRACRETLAANGHESARIRLTASGGEADSLPWSEQVGSPTVLITARPYLPFPDEKYSRGFRIGIAAVRRCRSLAGVKSTSHIVSVLARKEAVAKGLDEALLLNEEGYIAEGGGCNVFFVASSGLITPSLDSGILPGVTRRVVIELAEALDISVTEDDVKPGELKRFDEAFLTNSMIELMPLVAVVGQGGEEITIGTGSPGSLTSKLMKAYRELVLKETV